MTTLSPGEARWLRKTITEAEEFVRFRFEDSLRPPGGFSPQGLALRRRLFGRAVGTTRSLLTGLQDTLKAWRGSVERGEAELDPDLEEELKETVFAWTSLGKLLLEKAAASFQEGVILAKPFVLAALRAKVAEAEAALAGWTTPVPKALAAAQVDEVRSVRMDTDRVLTREQRIAELDRVSRPTTQENVPLKGPVNHSLMF